MTRRDLLRALHAGALVACAPACNAILGIEPFQPYEPASGGAASSSSSSSASASSSATGGQGAGGTGGGGGAGGSAPLTPHAVLFDGTGACADFGKTSVFTSITGFSWELWFRPDAVPQGSAKGKSQTLVSAADMAGCEDIYLGFGSEVSELGMLTFVVDGKTDCGARDGNPARKLVGIQNGSWHHAAGVMDPVKNETRLYFDGGVVATESRTIDMPVDRALFIRAGCFYDGNEAAYFKGAIDELRLYSGALQDGDVQAHYANGLGTYAMKNDPGLAGGWHFDEGSGATAADIQGNTPSMLLMGATWTDGHVAVP